MKQINDNGSGYEIFELSYFSTNQVNINGWILIPKNSTVTCGLIVGHGYGGRDEPDCSLSIPNSALLFPCFRGLSRSHCAGISSQPEYHILHNIDQPENYILGGCVEDLWLAVSSLLQLFPLLKGHVGYMGSSFGGGIGALAAPWDTRVQKIHINVPSFGHQPLRLKLPTCGSAASVQNYVRTYGDIDKTLQYYDAAIAATFAKQPLHAALAYFDPAVAPPGQYAIYNAWAGPKILFALEAGHFNYPNQLYQEQCLLNELHIFFSDL